MRLARFQRCRHDQSRRRQPIGLGRQRPDKNTGQGAEQHIGQGAVFTDSEADRPVPPDADHDGEQRTEQSTDPAMQAVSP